MAQSGVWPVAHAEALAAFFVAPELHPRRQNVNGKKAFIMYQSVAGFKWLSTVKQGEGFDIELINEELLRSYADLTNDQARERRWSRYASCTSSPSNPLISASSYHLPIPVNAGTPTARLSRRVCCHLRCTLATSRFLLPSPHAHGVADDAVHMHAHPLMPAVTLAVRSHVANAIKNDMIT